MGRIRPSRLLAKATLPVVILLASVGALSAATITATVTDEQGRPLPDAVVMIAPGAGQPPPPSAGRQITSATIEQRDETFIPMVVVIHTGGSVIFRNSDRIRHHVYSFSPIHQFEFVQPPGDVSPPIRFDRPGEAALGCNIHDQMIAYVYVTDSPWASVTTAAGQATIAEVPPGNYTATVWHPRLKPRSEPAATAVFLATDNSALSVTLPVLPPRRARGSGY
jgi:plastocyanin